ncbi:BTAD domain-containing putative transcriptional regulator [Streptomyces sp. 900105755]
MRSDALDAYRRLRTTLARDQGLEPSAALGRIRQSVLSAPADDTPAPADDTQAPGTADPLARIG